MGIVRAPLRRLGRAALAAMFIAGGAEAFRRPAPRALKAARLGIPNPELAVRANGAAMVAAGAAMALGYRPRAAATVLAACLVPTTLAGHRPAVVAMLCQPVAGTGPTRLPGGGLSVLTGRRARG